MLHKLEELNQKRTRGTWSVDFCGDIFSNDKKIIALDNDADERIGSTATWTHENYNAAFIATMANVADEILRVLKMAQKMNNTLREHELVRQSSYTHRDLAYALDDLEAKLK